MRNANAPEPRIRNGGTWIAADDPPGIGLSKSLPGLKVPWSVETWTDTDSGLADGLVISTEVLRSAPASPPANVHCERVVGWPGTKIFCWSFWEMTAPATTRPDLAITSIAGLSAISSPFDRVWTLAERGGTNSSAAAGIHQRSVGPAAQLACAPEPTAIGALNASTCR